MSNQNNRTSRALLLVTASLLGGIADLRAQEADQQTVIPEVVVTAQKRAENVQMIPLAISALSSEDLEKLGVKDFAGIARSSTSINYTPYPSSSNMLILYMRGLGVADPNQITQDGSVGLYLDGFYISRAQLSTFDLGDVERVEILRGPQGTLYGRNTTGGAINIITRKPTGTPDFKGTLTFGSRGNTRALATVNLPSAGGLSAKVTLLYSNLDGYTRNPGPGEDFGLERQRAERLSLRFDRGGAFTADYFYEHVDLDSTPIYYEDPALDGVIPGYNGAGQPNSVAWRAFALPLSTGTTATQGITLSWKVNDSATLRSLSGYRTLRSHFFQDYADAFTDPTTAPFIGREQFTSEDLINSHTFSQEIQLLGDLARQLKYVFGLYYFKEGANHLENGGIQIPGLFIVPPAAGFPGITFDQLSMRYVAANAKSAAVYGQVTWNLPGFDDKLTATLGMRYTHDDRDASRNESVYLIGLAPSPGLVTAQEFGAMNDQSFNRFNPAGALSYTWTADLDTYLRVATGYKAGGSSEAGPIGSFGITYGPETVTQYELGLKSYWLERSVRANVALYHSDLNGLQLAFQTDPSNLGIVLTENAGSATIDGAELETLFLPAADVVIGLSYAYLDPKVKEVQALAGTVFDPAVNPASPYKVGQNVASLFRLPYTPRNIFSANTDWKFLRSEAGSLSLGLNYRYQDRQYDSTATGPGVPNSILYSIAGYGLLDTRVTWNADLAHGKRLLVSLWGRNVTGKHYLQHVIGQGPFLPSANPQFPGGLQPAGYYYQSLAWAPRPLYGIEFSYGR